MIRISFLTLLVCVLLSASVYAGFDEVLSTYPEDGAEYVNPEHKIKVFFPGERNASDYEFIFTPSVSGSVTSFENGLIFTPEKVLGKSTSYEVTVKSKTNNFSYSWSFTTNSTSLPPAKGTDGEKLAGIALGDSVYTVLDLLGEPDEKTDPRNCPATGEVLQHYIYTTKGIDISLDTARSSGRVSFITITSPCKEGTLRGIKIGDPESKVRANYIIQDWRDGHVINDDPSSWANSHKLCGSGYPGIDFFFDGNGRVKEIKMGQVKGE